MQKLIKISPQLHRLASQMAGQNFEFFVVGGAVRDALLGHTPKDIDIAVTGGTLEQIQDAVEKFVPVRRGVVSDAPVFHAKVGQEWLDVAVARVEHLKDGVGPTGQMEDFEFVTGFFPDGRPITIVDDLERRDFTVNAMAWHITSNRLIDPFGGFQDLRWNDTGRLMPIDDDKFARSAERVLRGAHLTARFGFALSPKFVSLARQMLPQVLEISKEQWWRHFEKILLSPDPARGMRALVWCGLGDHLPGWKRMSETEQDAGKHPEGTVDVHTLMALNVSATLTSKAALDTKRVVRMAAILHDIAKPAVTSKNEAGRIVSLGHDSRKLIAPLANDFMQFVGFPHALRLRVINLCVAHMRQAQSPKAVRRLARDLHPATVSEWALLVMSDMAGRDVSDQEKADGWNTVAKTVSVAKSMDMEHSAPQPLVMGRHLIDLGMLPSPSFGPLLKEAFDAQLDGVFDTVEGGLKFLETEGLL